METFIGDLDARLAELVDKISSYEPVEDTVRAFADLDHQFVEAVAELRKHYDACKRLEQLRKEGASLDSGISDLLVELARCRKELETPQEPLTESKSIDASELLAYATKITRFTHKLPGSESVLPWPTEDQLRRGMLATLTVQAEQRASDSPGAQEPQDVDMIGRSPELANKPAVTQRQQQPAQQSRPQRPTKISLDMDSDDD